MFSSSIVSTMNRYQFLRRRDQIQLRGRDWMKMLQEEQRNRRWEANKVRPGYFQVGIRKVTEVALSLSILHLGWVLLLQVTSFSSTHLSYSFILCQLFFTLFNYTCTFLYHTIFHTILIKIPLIKTFFYYEIQ